MSLADKLTETLRDISKPRRVGSVGEKEVGGYIFDRFLLLGRSIADDIASSEKKDKTEEGKENSENRKKDEKPAEAIGEKSSNSDEPDKDNNKEEKPSDEDRPVDGGEDDSEKEEGSQSDEPSSKDKEEKKAAEEKVEKGEIGEKIGEVIQQHFTISSDTRRIALGSYILFFMALLFANFVFLIYFDHNWAKMTMIFTAVILMAFLIFGLNWNWLVENVVRRKTNDMLDTMNVIYKVDQKANKNVIFTAHYDSKSAPINFLERLIIGVLTYGVAWLFAFYSLITPIYTMVRPVMPPQTQIALLKSNVFAQFLCLWVMAVLAILYFLKPKNESPGALDNASGVSVMLNLAEHFAKNRPENLNMWFVATAAEEEGLVGMVRFLDEYEKHLDKKNTYFINLDSVGGQGKLEVIDEYGIPPLSTSYDLTSKVRKAAQEEGFRVHARWAPPIVAFDSIPPAYHHYQALSLAYSGFDQGFLSMHSKDDVPENIRPESLVETYKVCRRTVELLDADVK